MTRARTVVLLAFLISVPAVAYAAPAGSRNALLLSEAHLSSEVHLLSEVHRAAAQWACTSCKLSGLERRVLAGAIAEYSFDLRVGPGEHDSIGLHRVVRERAPFVPAHTRGAVFLAHGDVWNFDAAFLASAASASVPDDQALPVFLAENGFDVWGIDFRWTRVPLATADLSFMAEWGIETDARDVGVALAAARITRLLTGHGFGRFHLLGWSRGGQIGYAYLNGESQVPAVLRQVKGFIPVDIYLKTDVPALQAAACTRFAGTQARIDGGEDAESLGQLVATLGGLALAAPGDPSPVLPGFTNEQAALLVGEATFTFFPPGLEPVPFYHFNGGTFDGSGLPSGLLYTSEPLFFGFLTAGSPWQPLREVADGDAAICDGPGAPDVAFDDHLDDITVPVLYVGAGGGFGDYGTYTTTLLGSTDVETLVASLLPPGERPADFGHADLFQGNDAETLVWEPILEWLEDH